MTRRRDRAARTGGNRQHMIATAYDEHGAAVFGLAHRVTGDAGVAAILTAETFNALDHVTDETTLQPCMLVDVHRRAVAWRREHDATESTSGRETLSGPAALVRPGLSGDERELVEAAYFGGLTYRDLAVLLGKDGAEVAALLQRGLERLASSSRRR